MIVFLEPKIEGINWESRNAKIYENSLQDKQNRKKKFGILRYYECLILAVVCYILCVMDYFKDKEMCPVVIMNLLWPLLLVIMEILITVRINSGKKEKERWIRRWERLKISEQK